MKAISIQQPFAHLIVEGIKDIENRTWKTSYRGTVLIHASQKPACKLSLLEILTPDQLHAYGYGMAARLSDAVYNVDDLHRSAIIGQVDIVDCVQGYNSLWAENGENIWHWVLANPVKFDKPYLNVNGKLSFWDYDIERRNKMAGGFR